MVAPDAPAPDAPAPDALAPDAPAPDAAPVRCARDLDCSGVTFCSPDGLCVPLVCTPGRLMCVSPSRAQVCDGRGATFSEMDCPGGCVLSNCMGATNPCPTPRVMCGAACVDPQTAAAHCGRCGNACAAGDTCVAGACVTPCAAPRLVRGGPDPLRHQLHQPQHQQQQLRPLRQRLRHGPHVRDGHLPLSAPVAP